MGIADHGPSESAGPKRQLSLFDSTSIIVGIIIGAGVYQIAPDVARGVFCPAEGAAGEFYSSLAVLLIWLIGGLLSLCGAITYAELATAYPQEGGDYVYLTRAFGRWAGFLFGWIQLVVVRPGDIALMALAFATYASQLYDPLSGQASDITAGVYSVAAVMILTAINVLGVREGKWVQNLLTSVKVLGLAAIIIVAVIGPGVPREPTAFEPMGIRLALIFVLFAFGGWNEMAYVAAEVRNPDRNILRALVVGTATVTVLYVLLNGAFLYSLGYYGLANSKAVAADAIATVFPDIGSRLISALICISALGAVNGLIFTGARISYALGADHHVFNFFSKWDPRTGTPLRALVVQGGIACTLLAALGNFIDVILYTAAAVYAFYFATSMALLVLRVREPHVRRPYRATGYPFTTLIFAIVCLLLIHAGVTYRPIHSAVAAGLILLGLPIFWLTRHIRPESRTATQ